MRFSYIFIFCLFFFAACQKKDYHIKQHQLPRLELTIEPDYLWSPDSGLYIIGSNGVTGCSDLAANYNQKWEHPAYVEYYADNELKFNDYIGFRIKGKCSRAFAMKSIGLYWRSDYGNSRLNYPLFQESNVTKYKRLILRNSGDDFAYTLMKDAVNAKIIRAVSNVDVQSYQPCVVYLNDKYWGIHNIREIISPRFFQFMYDVDDDEVDLLAYSEVNAIVDDGSAVDFNNDVIQFLRDNDVSESFVYDILAERMDIESYIDYIIIQTYIVNRDWPVTNTKWWRDNTSEEYKKWRWIVYDTDRSLEKSMFDDIWIGDLYEEGDHDESKVDGFFIFNHLLRNQDFKHAFLDRYMYFLNDVYNVDRTTSIINDMKSKLVGEYPNHSERWAAISMLKWENKIENMTEFFEKRTPYMISVIEDLRDEL